MRIELTALCLLAVSSWPTAAQEITPGAVLTAACLEFHQDVVSKLENGLLAEAEAALLRAMAAPESILGETCVCVTLNNLATVFALSGRLAEAEVLAEQSLRNLDKRYPTSDPIRFRPLHVLTSVQFQQGKRAKARETLRVLQSLRLDQPRERAMVSGLAALQFQTQGRHQDAEREYFRAVAAWEDGGRAESTDVAMVLTGLGTLYLTQNRYRDAAVVLDRALGIVNSVKDAVSTDRLKILQVRAHLHARQGHWEEARQDLRSGVSIADNNARLDPATLKTLLCDYAFVLRKARRKDEAHAVERRAASIRVPDWSNALVDVTELRLKN